MTRLHRAETVILPAFVLIVSGCDVGTADTVLTETTDSAGIVIVRNSSAGMPLRLDSEPVRALGGKETPEEAFYRVGSWNVGADGSGNLYVLDREAFRVEVFDSAGRHRRSLGGRGGGPGELQFPFALAVAEDGRAWVADPGKRGMVTWGPTGEVLDQAMLPTSYIGGEVKWTSSGMAVPLQDLQGQRLVVIRGADSVEVVASLPATEMKSITLESCGMSFSGMAPVFSPSLVWAAAGRKLVLARNPEYVVDIYEDGRLVRSVRRDVPPRPATAELAEASLGDGMRVRVGNETRVCDPAEVVEQRGVAPFMPMIERLALAPDGSVWAQHHTAGDEPGVIDIFDAEGTFLGTLPAASPFPIGFLPDGRMLAAEKDDLDVERLVIRTVELKR